MFIPTGIVTTWKRMPWANMALIALCGVAFWLSDFGRSASAREAYALWSRDASAKTFVTHLFMHANWLHLIGNMVFLWAFGNAAAGRLHPALYLAFFLVAGGAAAAGEVYLSGLEAHAQTVEVLVRPLPRGIPLVGASGAIMGVAGLCAVLFPFHRVRTLFIAGIWSRILEIPALGLVLYFAGLDLLHLWWNGHNGVAYVAHLSGFAAGAAGGLVLLLTCCVDRDEGDLLTRLRRRFGHAPQEPLRTAPRASRLIADPDFATAGAHGHPPLKG
jgi:membrane associated rhomboid family serine protease